MRKHAYFVAANSEEEAKERINKYIRDQLIGEDEYGYDGWGTDYYTLEIFDIGKVAINEND